MSRAQDAHMIRKLFLADRVIMFAANVVIGQDDGGAAICFAR